MQMFVAVSLAILMTISAEKDIPVPAGVNTMLVSSLRNQLDRCMNQNADLIKMLVNIKTNFRLGEKQQFKSRTIAFHAEPSSTIKNLPYNSKVVFDKVSVNEGGAYDYHSGIFTCPSGGLYAFDWTILNYKGKASHTDIMVNGAQKGSLYNHPRVETHPSASKMVIMKLKKGDKVWIEPHRTNTVGYINNYWSSFSGFKL